MAKSDPLSERGKAKILRHLQNQPASLGDLQSSLGEVAERAVQTASTDPKVVKRLEGSRFRVMGSDLSVTGADIKGEKPAPGEAALSVAEVGIYDYDRNVLLVATVDLGSGTVAGIEERAGVQPPLTSDELEEAKDLLLAEARFRSLKKRSRLEVIAFPSRAAFDPSHPAFGHRCFSVYLWTGGKRPTRVGEAVLDMSTRKLYPWTEASPA